MKYLIKIFVDDKYIDTEDGFTIFTYNSYKAGIIVEEAINNGFNDIRISKADAEETVEYNKTHDTIELPFN